MWILISFELNRKALVSGSFERLQSHLQLSGQVRKLSLAGFKLRDVDMRLFQLIEHIAVAIGQIDRLQGIGRTDRRQMLVRPHLAGMFCNRWQVVVFTNTNLR